MRQITKVLAPMLASLLIAACGSSASSTSSSAPGPSATTGSQPVPGAAAAVRTASNSTVGATVLVNSQGITLYRLSGEQNGKWICTAGCVAVWHPLIAQSGTSPKGSVRSLGTVKRPDGTTQVTYKGMPLYTFAQDLKPGDAKGQGIKDVGTWNAVTTSAAASAKTSPSTPAPASGGSSGY
jgi:predicted lipoprotein with Yx(FWY)xxD motif